MPLLDLMIDPRPERRVQTSQPKLNVRLVDGHDAPTTPLPAALVRRGAVRLLFKRLTARHDADAAPIVDADQSVSTANCVLMRRNHIGKSKCYRIDQPDFWYLRITKRTQIGNVCLSPSNSIIASF